MADARGAGCLPVSRALGTSVQVVDGGRTGGPGRPSSHSHPLGPFDILGATQRLVHSVLSSGVALRLAPLAQTLVGASHDGMVNRRVVTQGD